MQTARRSFLKYTSILGLISLTSISLFGAIPKYEEEEIGTTYMDVDFDPDSWL